MATRPIPEGSCNVAINMARDFRLHVGKLAHLEGKSIGQLVRELLEQRIEQAERAGRVIRRTGAAAGLVILGIGALAFASVSPAQPLVARRMRTQRVRVASVSFAHRIRCTRAAA